MFECAFLRTEAHRARQQQGVGFAHWPNDGVDRIATELLERGDPFMAINNQIMAVIFDNNDGCLLSRLSQRGQQVALAERVAGSQCRPAAVELVKLQLHED